MVKSSRKRYNKKAGKGFVNKLIDKLPFELHVPSYQYCGPGTKLEKRLARGDPGINPLDVACKQHDIAYSKSKGTNDRYLADTELQKQALKRVFSRDASLGERSTALAVSAAMKAKRLASKIGAGIRPKLIKKRSKARKSITFHKLVREARNTLKKNKPEDITTATKTALAAVKKQKMGKLIKTPRVIKIPTYTGGVLPLIPIFAGLSALGALTGSSASVINAINNAKSAQKMLDESQRHNKAMESIAIGKGYYLHGNPEGKGYYLKRDSKNS